MSFSIAFSSDWPSTFCSQLAASITTMQTAADRYEIRIGEME